MISGKTLPEEDQTTVMSVSPVSNAKKNDVETTREREREREEHVPRGSPRQLNIHTKQEKWRRSHSNKLI